MNVPLSESSVSEDRSVITVSQLRTLSFVGLGLALVSLLLIVLRTTSMDGILNILEDFDTELPQLTVFVLDIPRVAYLFGCITLAVVLMIKESMFRDKGLTFVINMVAAGTVMAMWVLIQYALNLPMLTLIQSINH